MKKRLNIGLLVPYVDNDYSSMVINGALKAAEKNDINLFIISVRYIRPKYTERIASQYKYQFTALLRYVTPQSLDGVVIESASIGCFTSVMDMKQAMSSFGNMPVVTLCQKMEGYSSLKFNCSGLKEELRHLINVHNKRKIAFIGGPASNEDSVMRFSAFCEVMKECGIDFSKKMYAEGDMSEFSRDAVSQILDTNPGEVDAILFANDRMAIAGYEVLKNRGIKIGEEIAIVGYDDTATASVSEPKMTTVHTDVHLLGYRAVEECISLIRTGKVSDIVLNSKAVVRESCGCSSFIQNFKKKMAMYSLSDYTWEHLKKDILEMLNGYSQDQTGVQEFLDFCDRIVAYASGTEKLDNMTDDLRYAYNRIDFSIVSYDDFVYALEIFYKKIYDIACPHERINEANIVIETINRFLIIENYNKVYVCRKISMDRSVTTGTIINNVLSKIDMGDECFFEICSNLGRIGVRSSTLFMHPDLIVNRNSENWVCPAKETLVCSYNDGRFRIKEKDKNEVPYKDIFRLSVTDDRRYTQLVLPLYYHEENYGILILEAKHEDFQNITCITHDQINFVLRMKHLTDEHAEVHRNLEKNIEQIKYSNAVLNNIVKSDDLTGILNRRGFMHAAADQISLESNSGHDAVIVFIDMNNLKAVNDSYGHENGDYSLKSIAAIMKKSFRSSDVIGRIGGDEFAAFALVDLPDLDELIRMRIEKYSRELNRSSGKPYNITVSVGIYRFRCSRRISLSQIMRKADELLYDDKKKKPSSIFKSDSTVKV